MKKKWFSLFCEIIAMLFVLLLIFPLSSCAIKPIISETTDLSDYGVIIGTRYRNTKKWAEADFWQLFPASIDPSFEDVQYHYKAIDGFSYAYEASLEFTIADSEKYNDFLLSLAPLDGFRVFPYDDSYLEYLPRKNYLSLCEPDPKDEDDGEGTVYYRIREARIDRVLIQPSEQRVLFFLLRTYDDCQTKTSDLDELFVRFNIDSKEFSDRLNEENGPNETGEQIGDWVESLFKG